MLDEEKAAEVLRGDGGGGGRYIRSKARGANDIKLFVDNIQL